MVSTKGEPWWMARDRAVRAEAERVAASKSNPPVRASSNEKPQPVLTGYAAVFNSWTTLYKGQTVTLREVVRPGAFREALRENQDVILNFNHNNDYLLARTASGTLKLREDAIGLKVEATLADSGWNRDRIITPAKRRDLVSMSFAFLPKVGGITETRTESRETGQITIDYEITSVDLFDVSVVYRPAYPAASFAVRSRTPSQQHREFLRDLDLWLAEAETTLQPA